MNNLMKELRVVDTKILRIIKVVSQIALHTDATVRQNTRKCDRDKRLLPF